MRADNVQHIATKLRQTFIPTLAVELIPVPNRVLYVEDSIDCGEIAVNRPSMSLQVPVNCRESIALDIGLQLSRCDVQSDVAAERRRRQLLIF